MIRMGSALFEIKIKKKTTKQFQVWKWTEVVRCKTWRRKLWVHDARAKRTSGGGSSAHHMLSLQLLPYWRRSQSPTSNYRWYEPNLRSPRHEKKAIESSRVERSLLFSPRTSFTGRSWTGTWRKTCASIRPWLVSKLPYDKRTITCDFCGELSTSQRVEGPDLMVLQATFRLLRFRAGMSPTAQESWTTATCWIRWRAAATGAT